MCRIMSIYPFENPDGYTYLIATVAIVNHARRRAHQQAAQIQLYICICWNFHGNKYYFEVREDRFKDLAFRSNLSLLAF